MSAAIEHCFEGSIRNDVARSYFPDFAVRVRSFTALPLLIIAEPDWSPAKLSIPKKGLSKFRGIGFDAGKPGQKAELG